MKKQEKMIFTLLALFVALLIITSCTVKSKVEMKQDKMNVSSSIKEDTATVTQRQVDFLKKHESEITNYIKSNDPEVVQVKYDWDSVKVGDSGAFTESGFDIRLKVYGQIIRNSMAIHSLLYQNQMLRIQVQLIQSLVRIFLDKINRSFYPLRGKNLSYESIIAQGMTGGHFKE